MTNPSMDISRAADGEVLDENAKRLRLLRLIAKETGVSFLVTFAINVGLAVALFSRHSPIPLWGHNGIASDLLPSIFMPACMMTVGITMGMRGRGRRGTWTPAAVQSVPWPKSLWIRAIVMGGAASLLMAPLFLAAIILFWNGPWSWLQFVEFKFGLSLALAVVMTPVVVLSSAV